MSEQMIRLHQMKTGQRCIVENLLGRTRFLSRASSMGFVPKTVITMISNGKRGPLIVRLRDSEIAIGRKEADKIIVRGERP
ncbi:MAG: FeoA family protein [Sphaerochaetaceae bacterium]|nr:FeoA family protein [Sphaerochaetaceae bacterium]MDC7247592.1 FeoA family protein [Sphaerochaetaceae bacterium]